MTSLDTLLIGKTIDGKFRITRHLGTGGMGTAYEAIQKDLNRQVCLKFLKSDALSSLDSVNRFKREARVLASLHHRNIVECFSFGVYEKVYPYLALEFVEGMSLSALTEKESPHWTRVVRLVVQVCEALEYAHNSGFIHRDIKPVNIMITRGADDTELVKVVDFGLVGKQQGEFVFDTLTDPQSIIGSVNYMPPEAFRGSVADASLDVYAVGCLLYESLSGRLPFEAENPIAVMFKHTTERLPNLPVAIKPDSARRALDELIHKATEADKSTRLQSCGQIREHLLAILEQQSSSSSSWTTESEYELRTQKNFRRRSSRKWLVPVVTATVVILVTTIAMQINLRRSVADKNHLLLHGPGQLKQGPGKDSKITFNDALSRFRSIVMELEGTSGAKSKETANSFHAFLEQYSFALSTDNTEVQKLAETACTKLSKLQQETSLDPNTRTQLFELQCDLLTSLGYYENTLDLLKARESRPARSLTSGLHKGGQEELVQLHDYVLGDNKKEADRFLLERLRPAAAFYPNLKDDGKRFFRLVNQLNNAERKDHWSPRLIEIADKVLSNRDERLVQRWIELCQISIRSDEPEPARSLLPKIRKEMTRYPLASIDKVASLYDRLDKTEEGLRIIQDGCEAARRRSEHYQWCLWRKAAIEILARRGMREEARETLKRVLSSEHWTPDRYDRHRNFEWFELVYRFSNLSFELQDYTSFLKLYNHAMKMRTEPDFEERCFEISVNYARLLWRMNRDREAIAVIREELARATASQKLRFAEFLCDMSVRPDTVKNRIRIIRESASVVNGVLKDCGKLDAASANRCKKSLLSANLGLAAAYVSDGQWKKATDVYLQITREDFGKISKQEKATYLIHVLNARRYAGDAAGCRKTAAEILEMLRKIPVWETLDYGVLENALSEYLAAETSHGDLRSAQTFLNAQVTQFSDKSPQQCYLQALEAHCSLTGQPQRLELGLAQLERAYQCLGALPPPDSHQVQFYCAIESLIANRFMELGGCEKAKTLLTSLASREGPSLRIIDAYCALAQIAYWQGDYKQALSALEMASTLSDPDLDKAIRTNFHWARILASQGQFPQALAKLDQLWKLVDKEENLNDKERNLIRVEVAYNALYKQWERPAEGQQHLEKATRLLESGLKKGNHYLNIDVVTGLLEQLSADAERHHNIVQAREFLEGLRNPAFLKLWGKNSYSYATGLSYYRIAKLYRRQNQDNKALTYLRQSDRFDRGHTLQLAEVEAAVGDKAAASSHYREALGRAQQMACFKNPVQDFVRARTYLSYACWLHDEKHYDQAKQYAGQAISLLSHIPGIYNRNHVGLSWMAAESDATLRNLERLAKWYTLDQKTVQRLISAQDQQ